MSMLKLLRLADTTVPGYYENGQIYINAANELGKMMADELPMSLKRAVFITENAYYHNTLDYTRYCRQIDSLVIICKAIMRHFGDSPDVLKEKLQLCHTSPFSRYFENRRKNILPFHI